MDIQGRLEMARDRLERVSGTAYLESLHGTLGADPLRPAKGEVETHKVSKAA